MVDGCVISFFYIKPQPSIETKLVTFVVLYLSSTSNHNDERAPLRNIAVVLYLSSTSNHNDHSVFDLSNWLCYIFLLHQTTTMLVQERSFDKLCYIFLLHQTTTFRLVVNRSYLLCYIFLLHQTTTKYHLLHHCFELCYIFLLHQTTTKTSIS